MPALEQVSGHRIVATPAALDHAQWADGSIVARFAPDEVLLVGAEPPAFSDPHALVAPDASFVAATVSAGDLRELTGRVPWPVPEVPGFAQGLLGGVPVKLVVQGDGSALLLTSRAFAEELRERLT